METFCFTGCIFLLNFVGIVFVSSIIYSNVMTGLALILAK